MRPSRAPPLKLVGHEDEVNAVECYGEGDARRAVSGGSDKTLLVWDLDQGRRAAAQARGAHGYGERGRVRRRRRRVARRERLGRRDGTRVGRQRGAGVGGGNPSGLWAASVHALCR